jgi:hypothetical protein
MNQTTPQSHINQLIFSAMQGGKQMQDVNERSLEAILGIISAITGYSIQNNISGLLIALKTHLNEFGFSELTDKEIILAFHMNCNMNLKYPSGMEQEIIHSHSPQLSVMYISKVLVMYMNFRKILIRKIENIVNGYE